MARFLPTRAHISLLGLTLILAACVSLPRSASPQPGTNGSSYLFISPNTDDHLSVMEAARRFDSPEHRRYRTLVGDVLQELGMPAIGVHDAVGDWSDGVENSLFVVLPVADGDTLSCAAAWFGLLAQQKSVLAFHPDSSGRDVLTILDLPGYDLATARRLLGHHGITDRTILAHARGSRVIVVDFAGQLGESLQNAARFSQGRLTHHPGRAESLAGSTRIQARQLYTEVIRASRCSRSLRPLARLP